MRRSLKLFSIALLVALVAFSEAFAATAPSIQARYVMFTSITTTTARVAWINGNGAKRIVVLATDATPRATIGAALDNTVEYTDNNGLFTGAPQVGALNAYVVDIVSGSTRISDVTGLTGNGNYYVHIFEYNTGGGAPLVAYNITAAFNNPGTLETGMIPPTGLNATLATATSRTVTWTDPNSPAATSYLIDVSTNSTFTALVAPYNGLSIPNVLPYEITGLTANTQYWVRVRGVSGLKTSDYSTSLAFWTGSTPPVLSAGGPLTFCVGGSVTLSFPDGGLTYKWYKDDVEFANPALTFDAVATGVYKVGATDANMIETFSNTITVTANAIPAAPTADANTFVYDGTLKTATVTLPGLATAVWYDAAVGGALTVAPSGTNVGTWTAWAASTENGCESTTRTEVTLTITPATLTVINAVVSAKVYDGNANATITLAQLNGVIGGDVVTLGNSTTGTFNNKNVGTNKPVTTAMTIGGAQAGNYTLTQPTLTGNITALGLTVTGAVAANKVYDATTAATVSGATLTGAISGDDVTLANATSGLFADKNIGAGKAVTTAMTLAGVDAPNYTLAQPALTANITAAPLTVTGAVAANKVYDATTAATVSGATLTGVILGDAVTLGNNLVGTFANKNVGTAKVVTTAMTLGGADAGNYTLTQPALTADITAFGLTVAGAVAANKVYDATTAATVAGATLVGVFGGDVVTLGNAAVGTFADKNVGTNKPVTTAMTLGGADAGNYTLTQPAGLTANITVATLTVINAVAAHKVYDATTAATISGATLSGILLTDAVTLGNHTVGTFADKNVGNAKPVTTAMTIGGADAGNYTLTQPAGLTANITAATLTVINAVAANKVYDGNTSATISGAAPSGILLTDVVTLVNATTGTFNNKNIGTAKPVTTLITLGGADAGNYTVTQPTLAADITPIALTVTATASNKVYDGTTAATIVGANLNGVILMEDVTLVNFVAGTFADKNVGVGKVVTTAMTLAGADVGNYTLTQPALTANITALALTVTAEAKTKEYGVALDPALTYLLSTPLVGGDVATGDLVRAIGENAGTYAISIGTLAFGSNYNVTFVGANFTITQKVLTVTADNASRCEGVANPAFTFQYSGFIAGEDATVLTTAPTASTVAVIGSPAGSYAITLAGGVATNYSFNYVAGVLTVNPNVAITVQPLVTYTAAILENVTIAVTTVNATSFQWEVSTDGIDWNNVMGGTNEDLALGAVTLSMSGYQYRLNAYGDCGATQTSNVYTLIVIPTMPATQAQDIVWNYWSRTEINFKWTRGNGEGCIVVVKQGANPDAPVDGTDYTANSVFGLGQTTAAGSHVVYKGTGNTAAVTGLIRNTSYSFHVFEYNGTGAGIIYNQTAAPNNPLTRTTSLKETVQTGEEFGQSANFFVGDINPNPATDAINFSIDSPAATAYTVELFSLTGERVLSTRFELTAGTNVLHMPIASGIASGVYSLRITDGIGFATKQVVVLP